MNEFMNLALFDLPDHQDPPTKGIHSLPRGAVGLIKGNQFEGGGPARREETRP